MLLSFRLHASGAGNEKAAHRGGIPGRLGFGLLIPRIERFHAQGTVASPARLPDSENSRITLDALLKTTFSTSFVSSAHYLRDVNTVIRNLLIIKGVDCGSLRVASGYCGSSRVFGRIVFLEGFRGYFSVVSTAHND